MPASGAVMTISRAASASASAWSSAAMARSVVGELHRLAQRQLVALRLELEPGAAERGAVALERLQRHRLVERVLLGLEQVLLGGDGAVAQLALARRRPLGERQAVPLQARPRARARAASASVAARRAPSVAACWEKSTSCRPRSATQAVALRPELAHDLALRRPEQLALPLGRKHGERRARGDLQSLLGLEPGQHAGLRRDDLDQPVLGREPAVDPRLARVFAEGEETEDPGDDQRREAGVDRVRDLRHEQHRAEPAILLLGDRLGAEEGPGSLRPDVTAVHAQACGTSYSLNSKLTSISFSIRRTGSTLLSSGSKKSLSSGGRFAAK